ncbi:MAG: hypothetical protein WCF54_07980 [Terracidiphilus sp.]
MKALSVRAPWWWAILHGKPVENRGWPTLVRGRVALHASKFWCIEDIALDWLEVNEMARASDIVIPEPDWKWMRSVGGCFVGTIEITDCVQSHPSPFFVGPYGFVLHAPIRLEVPMAVKGKLGFFDVPEF